VLSYKVLNTTQTTDIVYDLLQSLTLNGPAWSWINSFQRTRDGRNAWKSLINFYEGDSAKMRNKQEYYDAIAKATYQGTKQNFDFNSYVSIHQQAHQDLIRLGEPIPENKKVRDFLNSITDPQCSNIKLTVLANAAYMNDFPQTVNYIASAIDLITKNNSSSARQLANVTTGRGRGRGQGRGRGRSTRGRGQGRGRSGQQTVPGSSDSVHAGQSMTQSGRSYTPQEWQNLTAAQKRQIYRERECFETARTVTALLRDNEQNGADDVSALTTGVMNPA